MSKIIIVVRRGMVESVFSRRKDIEVEVVDFDTEDPDELKVVERRYAAIENSKSYKDIMWQ